MIGWNVPQNSACVTTSATWSYVVARGMGQCQRGVATLTASLGIIIPIPINAA